MIKEFFRQLYIHFDWFMDYPSHIFIVLRSFIYFMWYGYSFDDIANIDKFLLHHLGKLIPLYQRRADAVPMPLYKEEWTRELNKVKRNIQKLESGEIDSKTEMRIMDEISRFFNKYFWYLWY